MQRLLLNILPAIGLLAATLPSHALSADDAPDETARGRLTLGMRHFRENKIAESIKDFDRAAELDPPMAPQLWQRGISDYYAGKFDEGRRQFELHKTVNANDVENATWHFVCVARQRGIDAARNALMKIDLSQDDRVPMAEIYAFYAGRGSENAVLEAAKKADSATARMYAHLYLGLYFEAAGDAKQARSHLQQAADAQITDNYMHDVAKIHVLQRKWSTEPLGRKSNTEQPERKSDTDPGK
jgi:lipoprotein NlpI